MDKKQKILLVYPSQTGNFNPEIPLALLYVSSVLRENNIPCEIFDMQIKDYKECNLSDVFCVGITTMTGSMIKYGLEFAKMVREYDKKIPLIWGGVHPSLLPEQTVKSPFVDIVVRAEGELTFLELIAALKNKKSLEKIKGITYRDKGKIISIPDRPFMNLNSLPLHLPYDLLDMPKYSKLLFPIHTARGCPSGCTFCYNQSYNHRSFRYKSAKRVLDEVAYVIKKYKVKTVSFTWEDNFFVHKDRVEEICNGMIRRNFNIQWEGFCRFDYMSGYDDKFLKLVEKSGCTLISFGGESGNQELLDKVIHKGITIKQVKEATKKMAKTKISQVVSFMCGVPTETPEKLRETMDLIDELIKINPRTKPNGLFFYTPYPGTELFDLVVRKYHFKPPKSLEDWQDYKIYRDVKCTWLPKDYAVMLQQISIMTRFPFYTDTFKVPEQFNKFPMREAYRTLSSLARLRWKHRFFKYPYEWKILEKIIEKTRGFV